MNQKFLLLVLIANGIGTIVFSILYQDIYRENSLSKVIIVTNVAITILAVSAISGLALTIVGLVRAGSMTPKALAAIGVASFILGIYSLFASFGSTIGYGDETARRLSSWILDEQRRSYSLQHMGQRPRGFVRTNLLGDSCVVSDALLGLCHQKSTGDQSERPVSFGLRCFRPVEKPVRISWD